MGPPASKTGKRPLGQMRGKPGKQPLVFPDREATMEDLARFSHWAGIEIHLALSPIPPKKKPTR